MRIQLSGCVIMNNEEELLLLWKNKHEHYELPGGKVESDETLEAAAFRECQEELGVDVSIKKYIGCEYFSIGGKSFQSHKYLGVIENGQVPRVNEPDIFGELFWLPIKNCGEYSCASNVVKFCEKYISGEINLKH